MSEPSCPGCAQRDALIQALAQRVADLERQVKDLQGRLGATLSYLSGTQYASQRGLEDVAEVVFGVPVSLGSVTALQEQVSQALEPAHQEIADEVRPAPVKNGDETGWKQAGGRRWLWAA